MPVISLAMLVGLMAMAALPPLNGFAGEWVIYQSFFKLGNSGAFVGSLLGPLLAVGLAITGALAVMCMAKVYGVIVPGAPRTKEAENACCAPILMGVSVVALAICCVIGGVAAPWLLPMISSAVPLPLETANTTRFSANDHAAADRVSAAAVHHHGHFQQQPSAVSVHAVRHGCVVTITSSQW